MIDHILLGSSDLAQGILYAKEKWNLHPVVGGVHPQWGTKNSIAPLSNLSYLEIISPIAVQSALPPFDNLNKMHTPALFTSCYRSNDLKKLSNQLDNLNIEHGGIRDGSRTRPDGAVLSWRLLFLKNNFNGILPFFIQWNDMTMHPSLSGVGAIDYRLKLFHPDFEMINEIFEKLQMDMVCMNNRQIEIKMEV